MSLRVNNALRCVGVLVLTASGGVGASLAASAPAGATSVGGQKCTIVGTPGNDVLRGTSHHDVICGLGGNDILMGGGGNDTLIGGPGNDTLIGGGGDDTLRGGPGVDTASYRDHNTAVVASLGSGVERDSAIGETDHIGSDVENLSGGSGDDSLAGNNGNNGLDGGPGKDRLTGGNGNDTEHGGTGNDVLRGGSGRDNLNGGPGNDTISGDDGNDNINGGPGNDVEMGGAGNDDINEGGGHDMVDGGDGTNNISCTSAAASGNANSHDHGSDHCEGHDVQLQSYRGTVSAIDATSVTVQVTKANDTAQTWLDGHGDPNPVVIALTTTTHIEVEGGGAIATGDRVEVEAMTSADLSSLVAVAVQTDN
jgi:Ca2+-binding RTX toxin-like protein